MNDLLKRRHILVVNQHGENRGDEAAMRAMINSFDRMLKNVKFTIIAQLKDRHLKIRFDQDVDIVHMIMPIRHAIGLVIYAVAKLTNMEFPSLLNAQTKRIIEAYEACDLVVSAPGGPYFGDIYCNHELVHWFYIWLSHLYKKPLVLYAPSVGPFNIRLMNIVRKYLFKKFDVLCVREAISRDYLQTLMSDKVVINLTADSALQESLEPFQKSYYFRGKRACLAHKYLVSVSAIEYRHPNDRNAAKHHERYTQAILRCLEHVSTKRDCHFLFFPQLYGQVHSDAEYLEYLGQRLPSNSSWEIVDPKLDSNVQRRLLGMTDLCIASRYHPQVFAASSGIPGICIYYEHKALGFMSLLGLRDFAFDIRNVDADAICHKLDDAMEHHEQLSSRILENIAPLQKRARRTTRLMVEHLWKNRNNLVTNNSRDKSINCFKEIG